MSGFQTDLLTGFAGLIATAGLGTYDSTDPYTADQTGIVFGDMPQTPDRIIALDTYPVSDDPSLSDSVLGMQVRCRWEGEDPLPVKDLEDDLFDLLHGKTHFELSTGVHVVQCLRPGGSASLGQDQNGRWMRVQNFYVTVHRPSTNRT